LLTRKDLDFIQRNLARFDEVREEILNLSRVATRLSGSSILEIHRGDLKTASTSLQQVEKALAKIDELCRDYAELRASQGVIVAFQEFVEATTLRTYVERKKIPSLKEVRSDPRSYMLGLLDVVGEFRRMTLNSLRKGQVENAERLLALMEGIYEDLQSLEHTAIVPTFRVKMDSARRIIETTRGDVVTEVRRYSLEKALSRLENRLGSRSGD
jgi:translin